MAIVPNFSATQVLGSPSVIVLNDTSTGSDVLITSREVIITTASNQYLTAAGLSTTPTETAWSYATDETEIDCLTQDYAVYIRINWLGAGGNTLYTKITLYGFYSYTNDSLLQLTKDQIPYPQILADTNYWANKSKLHTLLKDAINAVEVGGDIYSAQNSLNAANYMIQNSVDYF